MAAGVVTEGFQQLLVNVAVIAAAFAAVAGMFAKVPPFKQIGRFFWCQLVTKPVREWFQDELHNGVCPIIKESVAEAVPNAVARAVIATVEPALATVNNELRDHMVGEETSRLEIAEALAAHQTRVSRRYDAIDLAIVGVAARIDRVEQKIGAPIPTLVGSVELHSAVPEEVAQSD